MSMSHVKGIFLFGFCAVKLSPLWFCFHRTGRRLCLFMKQIMSIWVSVLGK